MDRFSERSSARNATATAVQARDSSIDTRTRPTATATISAPMATSTRTPAPTATTAPLPAAQGLSGLVLPDNPDQDFTIVATQAEINDELRGQIFEMEGLSLRDVDVILSSGEIIADLQGTYSELGISAGVRVRGVPSAVMGQAYVEIVEVTLDRSVPGLVRLAAQRMIQDAIEQNSTEHGIAIPVEGVEVVSIQVDPQLLTIEGRTR